MQAQLSSDYAVIFKQVSSNSAQLSTMSGASVGAAAGTRNESKKGQQDIKTIISRIHEANFETKRTLDTVEKLLLVTKK